MRTELIVNTKSLGGTSDLTLLASIRPGLVPSLESVTYKTRVKRLLKALNVGRSSSHEYNLLRPFSDAVERVGRIHSVRVAVLEPENKVLLAATFDGAWESYIRVLWQKVGSLLDVIFCNTEDYDCACENTFDVWVAWARRVQVETHFFYATPELSVQDVRYLRSAEGLLRRVPAVSDLHGDAASLVVQSAEDAAWDAATGSGRQVEETVRQGLQALAFLYRLTDLYVPLDAVPHDDGGDGEDALEDDGRILRRAARDLLREFILLSAQATVHLVLQSPGVRARFGRQLDWLFAQPPAKSRPLPQPLPGPGQATAIVDKDIQGGILRSYDGVTHGCLLLLSLPDTAAAKSFLGKAAKLVTTNADEHRLASGGLVVNVALTSEGLRVLGASEAQLAYFSQEFREGMEARASVLGDYRFNHPRRWRLPPLNGATGGAERVELSSVHIVIQLRGRGSDVSGLVDAFVQRLGPTRATILAVEPMVRHLSDGKIVEHFGFLDGDSQPRLDAPPSGTRYPNQIHLGEVLVGYDNEADPAPITAPGEAAERLEWLRNGSYLVVRKLRQDVAALYAAAEAAAPSRGTGTAKRDEVLAMMMGRRLDGDALAAPGRGNDFDYAGDAKGSMCPFAAHIRRANPRESSARAGQLPGGRTPRLLRRGMSYGPRFDHERPDSSVNAEERGLFFMTYNASISEQFEVVQRWLSGGNSTGVLSDQSDPFLGVARNGERRSFRFTPPGESPRCIALDGGELMDDAKPFVRLEWGSYLFVPSMTLLKTLATASKGGHAVEPPWSAAKGQALMPTTASATSAPSALTSESPPHSARGPLADARSEAWKVLLEDANANDDFTSASVLAAVRERHDGAISTPYGVLVADRRLLEHVLLDPERHYTVAGYHERMVASIGEIYLGLDRPADGGEYEKQSKLTNEAIGKIGEAESFALARSLSRAVLSKFIDGAKQIPVPADASRWDLNLDATEVTDLVLVGLCQHWFGLPGEAAAGAERPPIVPGRFRWDWKDDEPPTYPGHFTAPSRYLFQPNPGKLVASFGQRYGAALTAAAEKFLAPHRRQGTVPKTPDGVDAPLAAAVLASFPEPADGVAAARGLVGALMGFLPTVDGNLRLSLNEWLRDGSFWSLRIALRAAAGSPYEKAKGVLDAPLRQAMLLRPSPGMIWRRATTDHTLGAGQCPVRRGQTVALSIASATQQSLERSPQDPEAIYAIFGGNRAVAPHPTHACPGYHAAMGVLLGVLSAFLEVDEAMRPSNAPLAFTFEGPMAPVPA